MLVGRSSEVARIESLLEGAAAGRAGSLVLRGEPGIGKSALLASAAERAAGFLVLRALGVESEAELPCGGLHQLLRPLLPRVNELPAPQAAALRAAFALDATSGTDRFAIYAGALGLIAAGAEQRAILCLVDDAQWLDPLSAEALAFVARRLDAECVAMLFAARTGERIEFAASGVSDLEVPRLGDDDSVALLHASERPLGAAATKALLRVASGNPLALLELPRGLSGAELSGSTPLEDPPAVPRVIEAAFASRVRQLSPRAKRTLLLAAASHESAAALLAAACDADALDEAEDAGLLRVTEQTIEFRHPLVRAAAYHAATSGQRRAAHAALAHVLSSDADQDARAWHLAAAATGPDEPTAALLEDLAARAAQRGDLALRARALTRAAELTADRGTRGRRLLEAGHAAWLAGHVGYATSLLDRAELLIDEPLLRGDLVLTRAQVSDQPPQQLIEAAAAIENSDRRLAAAMYSYAHDWAWGECRMTEAQAFAEHAWDLVGQELDRPRFDASSAFAWQRLSDIRVGEALPIAHQTLESAIALEHADGIYNAAGCAALLVYAEDERARNAIDRLTTAARKAGALPGLHWALIARSELELRCGDIQSAFGSALEALTVGELLGGWFTLNAAPALAHVEAIMGRTDECQTHAATAIQNASDDVWLQAQGHRARGVLALAAAEIETAVRELGRAIALTSAVKHPGFLDCQLDHVEALQRHGQSDHANSCLAELESNATRAGLHRTLARSLRCRAFTVSPQGVDEAFTRAITAAQHVSPLEEARARLGYGERLRRHGRRADSRVQLRAAHQTFEQVGAKLWADHARRELQASGATISTRDPDARETLTPQELQIATVAAQGKTNREISTTLFISPKTVEKHLSSAYRKLGIRSRGELIRLQLTRPDRLTSAQP